MNIKRIIKYIFAGGVSVFCNLSVLYICVNFFHIWYLLSASISFCGAVIVSYLLQKFFVFRDYSKEVIKKQFSHFLIYNIVIIFINASFMYLFVDILNIWYLISQAITALITAFVNYTYFNFVIFKASGD